MTPEQRTRIIERCNNFTNLPLFEMKVNGNGEVWHQLARNHNSMVQRQIALESLLIAMIEAYSNGEIKIKS